MFHHSLINMINSSSSYKQDMFSWKSTVDVNRVHYELDGSDLLAFTLQQRTKYDDRKVDLFTSVLDTKKKIGRKKGTMLKIIQLIYCQSHIYIHKACARMPWAIFNPIHSQKIPIKRSAFDR